MGRTVINQTENKQTIILNDSPEGVEGGYFDSEMLWHELGAAGADVLNRTMALGSVTKNITGVYPNKVVNYDVNTRARIPLPIDNPGKIELVDTVNYDIIGFGITDLAFDLKVDNSILEIMFLGVLDETDLNWKKEVESDAPYLWFAIRKTDNSEFSSSELENPLDRLYKVV